MNNEVDWTKPLQTREGCPAELLGIQTCAEITSPYVVMVQERHGRCIHCVSESGRWPDDGRERRTDIINVPPKKVIKYINVWKGPLNTVRCTEVPHGSKEVAEQSAKVIKNTLRVEHVAIAVPIEVEE